MARDKEKARLYAKTRREKYPERVKEINKKSADRRRPIRNAAAREWRAAHPEEVHAYNRQYHNAVKKATFEAYGGAICACCREANIEFLSLDHINGDGAAHRQEIVRERKNPDGKSLGGSIYHWLKKRKYPAGFRVLCMNCNWALGHSGYCPHNNVSLGLRS